MDQFTRTDLRQLAEVEGDPSITLFMPTYRAGREVRQNAIRFKNLIKEADALLIDHGFGEQTRENLLQDVRTLADDDHWWQQQSDGLAVFVAEKLVRKIRVPVKLDEQVTVGRRFQVRPLIHLVQCDGKFYLLAVSQNRVRLLAGTQHNIAELKLDELPSDLRSALNIDEYVSALQQHSTGRANQAGNMMFHGQGGSGLEVQKKDEIFQYFRRIDAALSKYLSNERVPLVFAGVDYLFPLYREACSYAALMDSAVNGNPDELSAEQLHPKAWSVVQSHFEAAYHEAVDQYLNHQADPGKTASHLSQVLRAAYRGAVETLLLARGEQRWGTVDEHCEAVEEVETPAKGAEELLNLAATQTLSHGGIVYSLPQEEMPNGQPAAAMLRFQVN